MQPSSEILAEFGVRLVSPLGGRFNQHWLVQSQTKQYVLRLWGQSAIASINYEVDLMRQLAALGWPVAAVIVGPTKLDGDFWSLAPFLIGELASAHGSASEQRSRGRLLAQLHESLAQIPMLGQRSGWQRCEEILADSGLDHILGENEQRCPEDVRIIRWHLERARNRIANLDLYSRPGIVIHGDFTPWNLRFTEGRLSGVLDFELAHWNHRVAEFALSWRGNYDEVIYGYDEVSPLEPEEWEMITPVWWAWLIGDACRDMQNGIQDDGWTIKKLLQRSKLMGQDAGEFR